jgi:phage FluMu protein Com
MSRRSKLDIKAIRTGLLVECPKCHYPKPPAELKRPGGTWFEVLCPKCGTLFEIPQKGRRPCSTS